MQHAARTISGLALALTLAVLPAAAAGDGPVHGKGTWAAGGDLGFSEPIGAEEVDTSLVIGGYGEYFQTSQLSYRGMLSFLSFDGPGKFGVDVVPITGNVVFQWEGKSVFPFVTGGIGLYFYRPDIGDSDLEFGVNFGGGANFFFTKTVALKLEGLFHGTTGKEPDSFFAGTAGVRFLF